MGTGEYARSTAAVKNFVIRTSEMSTRASFVLSPVEHKLTYQVDSKTRQQIRGPTPKPVFVTVALRIPRLTSDDRTRVDTGESRHGDHALSTLGPRRDVLNKRIFQARSETFALTLFETGVEAESFIEAV